MAGFIVIQAAIRAEAERIRREEEEDKKKIEQGYTKEFVLENPKTCYVHYHRNLHKQQTGLLIGIASLLGILITINFMVIMPYHYWFVIQFFAMAILFLVGVVKYFNTLTSWSENKDPGRPEGCIFLSTSFCPKYKWEWIKKEKK